jgi:uncharacterized RDD family membrane protein YckC
MDERFRAEPPAPCRVSIDHLTPHQVVLLRTVLRSGEVPFGIVRGEIVAGAEWADEVAKAVAWASVDPSDEADEFDDPEYRSDKRPLVKPPRPPLRDGRRQATRLRRLSAGVIDEVLVGVPTLLAHRAGAAPWTGAVTHAICYIVPTTWFGWSIGKFWTGLRVVDRHSLRAPSPTSAALRWFVSAIPMLAALFLGLDGNAMTLAVFAVYVPIVADLRGVHDYAAGTVVAERTSAGPGIWVRQRSARKND